MGLVQILEYPPASAMLGIDAVGKREKAAGSGAYGFNRRPCAIKYSRNIRTPEKSVVRVRQIRKI